MSHESVRIISIPSMQLKVNSHNSIELVGDYPDVSRRPCYKVVAIKLYSNLLHCQLPHMLSSVPDNRVQHTLLPAACSKYTFAWWSKYSFDWWSKYTFGWWSNYTFGWWSKYTFGWWSKYTFGWWGYKTAFSWCMVQLRFACCIKHTFAWSKYFFAGSKYTFVWWSKHTFALCIVQLCFPWCSKHTFAWSKSFFAWSKCTFVWWSKYTFIWWSKYTFVWWFKCVQSLVFKRLQLAMCDCSGFRRAALLCNLDLQKTPALPDL